MEMYELKGESASNIQIFITDSTDICNSEFIF